MLRFCRSCYATLADDEAVCHACGAKSSALTKLGNVADLRGVSKVNSMIQGFAERLGTTTEVSSIEEQIDARFNHPDLFALIIFSAILGLKVWFAVGRLYQNWDGYVYLLNARSFASGALGPPNYFEVLRPPLYPFMISQIWKLFGESTILVMVVSPIFTVAAAALLYLLVKEMFDARAGLVGSVGFLLSPIIMSNTDAVLVHGVGVFFVTLVVFLLWRSCSKPAYYVIVGATSALASLTRYANILIALIAVVFVLVDLRDNPQRRKSILTWVILGAVVFVGVWLPWLLWCQYVYHDALISVKAGISAGVDVMKPVWFFYLAGLPTILLLPGLGFLLLGIVSKDWLKDRRRLLLAGWYLVFLVFYSAWSNQDLRYIVEWAPPLFAIVGIGVSTVFMFLRTRGIRTRKMLAISMSAIVGIWLVLLLLGSVVVETQFLSQAVYEGDLSVFGSVDGFQRSVSWLEQHMNQTEIGITDFAPYFSYFTHRFFYGWEYLLASVRTRNTTVEAMMTLLHVKYAVFRSFFLKVYDISNLAFLVKVQDFNGYSIYQVIT